MSSRDPSSSHKSENFPAVVCSWSKHRHFHTTVNGGSLALIIDYEFMSINKMRFHNEPYCSLLEEIIIIAVNIIHTISGVKSRMGILVDVGWSFECFSSVFTRGDRCGHKKVEVFNWPAISMNWTKLSHANDTDNNNHQQLELKR